MNDILLELLKQLNIPQLAAIALIGFFYYNRLINRIEEQDKKFEKQNEKLREEMTSQNDRIHEEIKSINQRIDKLYDTIIDLYRNLTKRDAV